jgi:hypothetical protein
MALVEAVGSPHLRLMLDIYHAQIGEGNLIELIRRAGPLIGEVQVADVPGRCEPGTGEINYPAIARALAEIGYRGTIGLEAWASRDDELALQRFRSAFTLAGGAAGCQRRPLGRPQCGGVSRRLDEEDESRWLAQLPTPNRGCSSSVPAPWASPWRPSSRATVSPAGSSTG